MSKDNNISIRAWVLFTILALSGLSILAKVFVIQTTDSDKWNEKGNKLDKRVMTITPTRGSILSSDGSIMVSTVPRYTLYWDSHYADEFRSEQDTILQVMADMFEDETKETLSAKFESAINKELRYAKIIDDLGYDEKTELKKLPILKLSQYKSGFIFNERSIRQKFFGQLASRTIGNTNGDSLKGNVGLELTYDKELGGVVGKQMKVRIPGGEWKPLSEDYIIKPQEGADLVSTIDIHLQDLVHTSLKKSMITNEAEWGCAILMEVETGKIKGIANLTRNSDGEYEEVLNHAIQKCEDPGSTFKLPVIMTCLEDGLIDINDSIDTEGGKKKFYKKTIRDSHKHGTGTVRDIIKWSSNVGMAKIVSECYRDDKQKFLDGLNRLHLGEATGVELIGETPPKLYKSINEDHWSGISPVQMAIGYEVGQTPIQTLTFYNAIANGGKMVRPIFTQEIRKNNKVIKSFDTQVIDSKICSESTLNYAKEMLYEVCNDEEGTAYWTFFKKPYKVAGKTGTAWVYDEGSLTYIEGDYKGSFVGYFPAEKPKYSCIVVINKPRGSSYYGSSVAAPVFRDIADMIYASEASEMAVPSEEDQQDLRITPVSLNGSGEDLNKLYSAFEIPVTETSNSDWIKVSTDKKSVSQSALTTEPMTVPDVVGMALQDAIFLIENSGLQAEVSGSGIIKEQIPKKGSPTSQHSTIKLILE